MEATQEELLKLARRLGQLENELLAAQRGVEDLKLAADKHRDLIFANLAGTGTPQERQEQLVRLLAQATQRSELRVNRKKRKPKPRPVTP